MEKKRDDQKKAGRQDLPGAGICSIRFAVSPERDSSGKGDYRTVFAREELASLTVDVELLNRSFGRKAWQGSLEIRIFRMEGKEARCIGMKQLEAGLEKEVSVALFPVVVSAGELEDGGWEPGVYRTVAVCGDEQAASDELHVVDGNGTCGRYFQLLHAGLDRIPVPGGGKEGSAPHSYRVFDRKGLENVCLFLVARNLLDEEWVYEFIVRVSDSRGRVVVERPARASHFVRDKEGNSLLCFGVALWEEGAALQEGAYRLQASCFGQSVLSLAFSVGTKDVPYDFGAEIAGRESPVGWTGDGEYGEVLDRLYRLVGLRKVKEEVTQMAEYADFVRLRRENGFSDTYPSVHLLFSGNPGTGRHTVARLVGEMYARLGLLAHGRVSCYSRKDFIREGAALEEPLLRQAFRQCDGGVLFIGEAADLCHPDDPQDRGLVVLNLLAGILSREHPQTAVILSDTPENMDLLQGVLPELGKVFPIRLRFDDYSLEELMEIARYRLSALQYRFTPAAEEKFQAMLKEVNPANASSPGNGLRVEECLEEAVRRMSRRLMANRSGDCSREELMLIREEDISWEPSADPHKPLEKLDAMVGMGSLKRNIAQHLDLVCFIRERQKHGFDDRMPVLNMIFCGNPGTGKMTVAKMMGEIYHGMGILPKQNVVMQEAAYLTAETGMEPQQLAEALMDAAAGGVLYIGHADFLMENEAGLAFLEGLLALLPDDGCGDTLVILGGDPARMQETLVQHPGLKAYFPYVFHFNDFTPEELVRIAENKLKESGFIFHPKARETFSSLLEKAYRKKDRNFGNVTLVDRLVGLAIRSMSERTMKIRRKRELTRQEMATIRQEDIPAAVFDTPKLERDVFNEQEIAKALASLEHLVGQAGVKRQIADFVELARHYSREGVKIGSRMSLQWCFTGNSGMGKGTVSRIIARLYKAMGIISGGQVVDFKVERMVGMMEDEAQRCIGEALARSGGGILLFDEDSPKLNRAVGFRERVRAILMNQMAERPGAYIVIYAESRKRAAVLDSTAEQASELTNVLVFEDYSKDELMLILKRRLKKENMKLTNGARRYMSDFMDVILATEERTHASSRLMRIVGDRMVRNCLQRMAKGRSETGKDGLVSVRKQDVLEFTEAFVAGVMKERKRIGFV